MVVTLAYSTTLDLSTGAVFLGIWGKQSYHLKPFKARLNDTSPRMAATDRAECLSCQTMEDRCQIRFFTQLIISIDPQYLSWGSRGGSFSWVSLRGSRVSVAVTSGNLNLAPKCSVGRVWNRRGTRTHARDQVTQEYMVFWKAWRFRDRRLRLVSLEL